MQFPQKFNTRTLAGWNFVRKFELKFDEILRWGPKFYSATNNYWIYIIFYDIFSDCLSSEKVNVQNLWPQAKECAFHSKSYINIVLKIEPK